MVFGKFLTCFGYSGRQLLSAYKPIFKDAKKESRFGNGVEWFIDSLVPGVEWTYKTMG